MSVLEGVDCIRHFILVPTSPIKTYLPIFKYRDDVPLGVNNINLNAATRLPFSREVQFSAENNFDMLLDNIWSKTAFKVSQTSITVNDIPELLRII